MTTTTIPTHPLTALLGRLSRHAALLLLLLVPISAFAGGAAVDPNVNGMGLGEFTTTSTTSTIAGGTMITSVGTTANQIANVLTGPVLWIVMGAAVILAIYGFAAGKMAMAFTGIGAFILAAVLKGLFALMK